MKLALNNLYDFPFVCINVEDHNGISEDVLNMNLGTWRVCRYGILYFCVHMFLISMAIICFEEMKNRLWIVWHNVLYLWTYSKLSFKFMTN